MGTGASEIPSSPIQHGGGRTREHGGGLAFGVWHFSSESYQVVGMNVDEDDTELGHSLMSGRRLEQNAIAFYTTNIIMSRS
jgi:hypothetical protein